MTSDPTVEQVTHVIAAILANFESVFDQEAGLRTMTCPNIVIQLREDALPYYVNGV